jgi:hypothetical protein
MARFRWEIEDVSDDLTPGQNGGTVTLEDLNPARGRRWDVGPPDPGVSLEPVAGGSVEDVSGEGREVRRAPSDKALCRDEKGVGYEITQNLARLIPTIILVWLVLLGFGFVAVVNHDVQQGRLSLETYVKVVGWIVGGAVSLLGGSVAWKAIRTDKGKQRDGGG